MAVSWPAFLQTFLNEDSFSYQIGETRIFSENDTGIQKSRRRYTKSIDTLKCTIDITLSDYQQFYDFWDVSLNGGINYFTFNHPFSGVPTDFRIKDPPSFSPMGGEWLRIDMVWEKKP